MSATEKMPMPDRITLQALSAWVRNIIQRRREGQLTEDEFNTEVLAWRDETFRQNPNSAPHMLMWESHRKQLHEANQRVEFHGGRDG